MADRSQHEWDVIVIGTGIGGGTVGRALADAGKSVLFLEKGPAGYRTEQNGLSEAVFLPEARLTRGLWPEPLHARLNGRDAAFFAPLGAGVGGSSAFYAATLERPERHDLAAFIRAAAQVLRGQPWPPVPQGYGSVVAQIDEEAGGES